jgi:hypothetical protein
VEAHQRLRHWWSLSSPEVIGAGQPETAILALEQRFQVRLPEDFRRYLLTSAPHEDFWDEEHTIWWPLGRIRNIPEEYEHAISHPRIAAAASQYLFFADYSIWCWAWAISCTDDEDRGRVALIGSDPDHFVANSFTDFVERYTRSFESVC